MNDVAVTAKFGSGVCVLVAAVTLGVGLAGVSVAADPCAPVVLVPSWIRSSCSGKMTVASAAISLSDRSGRCNALVIGDAVYKSV